MTSEFRRKAEQELADAQMRQRVSVQPQSDNTEQRRALALERARDAAALLLDRGVAPFPVASIRYPWMAEKDPRRQRKMRKRPHDGRVLTHYGQGWPVVTGVTEDYGDPYGIALLTTGYVVSLVGRGYDLNGPVDLRNPPSDFFICCQPGEAWVYESWGDDKGEQELLRIMRQLIVNGGWA